MEYGSLNNHLQIIYIQPNQTSRIKPNVKLSGWATITEKTMIKVKTIGQILPFKSGTALPSPAQAFCWGNADLRRKTPNALYWVSSFSLVLSFYVIYILSTRNLCNNMFHTLIYCHFVCWPPLSSMPHITILKLVITKIFKPYKLIFNR